MSNRNKKLSLLFVPYLCIIYAVNRNLLSTQYLCSLGEFFVFIFLTFSVFFKGTWPARDSQEPSWHFARTKRGGTILVVNGFQFYRYSNSAAGPAKRWLCNAYRHHG